MHQEGECASQDVSQRSEDAGLTSSGLPMASQHSPTSSLFWYRKGEARADKGDDSQAQTPSLEPKQERKKGRQSCSQHVLRWSSLCLLQCLLWNKQGHQVPMVRKHSCSMPEKRSALDCISAWEHNRICAFPHSLQATNRLQWSSLQAKVNETLPLEKYVKSNTVIQLWKMGYKLVLRAAQSGRKWIFTVTLLENRS